MTKTTVPTTATVFHVEHTEQTPGVLASPESDARVIAQQLLGLRIGESATVGVTTITRADDRWYIQNPGQNPVGYVSTAAAAAIVALGWATVPAPRGWEAV